MFRKLAVALATAAAALALVAPSALARPHHRYSSSTAYTVVENAYRSHCGNGTLWYCDAFPTLELSWPVGDHSWKVELHWSEIYISNPRSCAVIVRVEHDFIAQTYNAEWCWG
jgi:hypothetical protein